MCTIWSAVQDTPVASSRNPLLNPCTYSIQNWSQVLSYDIFLYKMKFNYPTWLWSKFNKAAPEALCTVAICTTVERHCSAPIIGWISQWQQEITVKSCECPHQPRNREKRMYSEPYGGDRQAGMPIEPTTPTGKIVPVQKTTNPGEIIVLTEIDAPAVPP